MNRMSLTKLGKLIEKVNQISSILPSKNYDKQFAVSYILTQVTRGRFEFYLPFSYNQQNDSEEEFHDFINWLKSQKIHVPINENSYQACKSKEYYPDMCEYRPHWSENKKCKHCMNNIYKRAHLIVKIEDHTDLDISLI